METLQDGQTSHRVNLKPGKIALVFLLIVLVAFVGLWFSGQLAFKRALGLLGINGEKYQVEAGMILAVPVVNVVWGRDISIVRQGQKGPAALTIGSIHARKTSSPSGKGWRLKLKEISWGREQAWSLGAEGFDLIAVYDPSVRRLSFNGGGFKGLDFKTGDNHSLSGSLDDFRFEQLAFGAGLAGEPLNWDLEVKGLTASEVKAQARFKGKNYDFKPFTLAMSGLVSNKKWALDCSLERLGSKIETEPETVSGLGALWGKVREKINPEEMLNFSKIQFRAAGPWKNMGDDSGQIESYLNIELPKLYEMKLEGESEPKTKDEALSWVKACLKRITTKDENERPDCLSNIAFDEMKVDYLDNGLMSISAKVGRFADRFKSGENRKVKLSAEEKYALPLLGLTLADWLVKSGYPTGARGQFTFEEQEQPLKPLTEVFRDDLSKGRIEPIFEQSEK